MKSPQRHPCPDLRADREAVMQYIRERTQETATGCWEWTGGRNPIGYGLATWRNRRWIATRLVQCATVGEFDRSMDVCHTCDNPPCCNPVHLWIGSRSDNIQDSKAKGRHALSCATHCRRGHELADQNLYIKPDGKRGCIACHRGAQRIRAGWPADLAYSVAPVSPGHQVVKGNWVNRKPRGPKTHCKNGHPLSGDNLYVVPSDGRRQCRKCKHEVVQRIAKRASLREPVVPKDSA